MRAPSLALAFAIAAFAAARPSGAVELQPGTVKAWDAYVKDATSRSQTRLQGASPFLWADEAAARGVRLRQGEVLAEPFAGRGSLSVPGGLIHHWIGAVFIPNATIEDLTTVLRRYDSYKEFYPPFVAESKALPCAGADGRFTLVWHHRAIFLNAAMEGDYQAHYVRLDAHRGYSIAASTRMQDIVGYGGKGAHLLPVGQGNGFLWRIEGILRYEERDRGVYLEIEGIALTRDIPAAIEWFVTPLVKRLSLDALTTVLRQTRAAVASAENS